MKMGTGDIPQEIEDNYKECVLNLIKAEKCRVLSDGKDNTIIIKTRPIINFKINLMNGSKKELKKKLFYSEV